MRKVSSTSEAVKIVAHEKNAAALATRNAAALYKLDVLEFPVEKHIVNVTQFFTLGHQPNERNSRETSLLTALKNKCGSLCEFLKPFAKEGVNLKRIVSRNVVGHPNTYVFFLGVEASARDQAMQRALKAAHRHAVEIRLLGSYRPNAVSFVSFFRAYPSPVFQSGSTCGLTQRFCCRDCESARSFRAGLNHNHFADGSTRWWPYQKS